MTEFEEIYRNYFRDVYPYLKSLTNEPYIAEEITSETFLKALKSIDTFRGTCDVRVWLCQIAKNCYFSYLRKHRRIVKSVREWRTFYEGNLRHHTGSAAPVRGKPSQPAKIPVCLWKIM